MPTMEALATYKASLQCCNWADVQEDGGVPFGQLRVWPDRLDMTTWGLLKLFFRPRTIAKERVELIRPMNNYPLAPTINLIDLVVSPPKAQTINTGKIHYILGIRSFSTADVLNVLKNAGFEVSHETIRVAKFDICGQLSRLDLKRPGRS
jgi:hypothetical protein